MKKFARIIALTLILITLMIAAFSMTACNQTVTETEARAELKEGIAASVASGTYYIKYRINDSSSDNGKYSQYSLNVQGETAKFTIANGDILKTVYEDTYYGKSLNKDASAKEAKDSDYVTGMLTWVDDKWQIKECSFEDFLSDQKIKEYNMKSVTDLLATLSDEELKISSSNRTGKVLYITAKVTKEGNVLAKYDSLNIRIVNGKLAYIGDAKESFNISISYGGPKINVPVWSTKVN